MALNTREMLLVLRVSDRTGGALHKVARDLGGVQNRNALAQQMQYRQGIAGLSAARMKDARIASAQATVTLRNFRLQKNAAESAIVALKQQAAQDAVVTRQINEQVASYNRLTAAIAKQTDVAKGLRTVRLQTALAAGQDAQAVTNLGHRIDQLKWAGLQRGVALMQHLGRAATIGGAIGTYALGASAQQAAGFQTQLGLAATQARPAGAPATATLRIQQGLMKVVLNQMKQFPAASQDMANSLYEIFSGTNIQNIPKAASYLRTFNQMAVAGGTDLKTMTDAGLTLYNNFMVGVSPEFKNMSQAANLFFAAVRYGRMNAEQFATSLSSVVPIAKEAGLSFRDVADAMAFLTRQSGAKFTSRDATGLMRLIQLFARPEMKKGLQQVGVQVEDLRTHKMRPLLQIMEQIANSKFGKSISGTVEAVTAFKTLSAAGGAGTGSRGFQGTAQAARIFAFMLNNIKEYHQVAQEVNRDQNEFNKSYAAMSQQPGIRWQVFTNQLKALSIVIGSAVIPQFAVLGGYIEKAINWFQQLSPHTQHLIAVFALFTSVGSLVGGVILTIVGGLASLFLAVRTGLVSFGFLGAETGAISARMALFMPILGGVLYLLIRYPGILSAVTNAVGGLRNLLIGLAAALAAIKFSGFLMGLTAVESESVVAAGAVDMLRLALLRISAIGVITLGVEVLLNRGRVDKAVGNFLDSHGAGFLGGTNEAKRTPKQAQALYSKFVKAFGKTKANQLMLESNKLLGIEPVSGVPDPTGKLGGIAARKQYDTAQAALERLNKQAAVLAIQTGVPSVNIQKLEANVLKAKEALRGISPLDIKKNMAAQMKLLDAESALRAATTTAQSQSYLKAVNSKYAAETKAQKKALSDQTKAAKAAATAQNTTYADALSNLKSLYQQFFGEQQSNFGSLFQGPVLTGARMQTLTQWGGHATGKDLLKDIKSQVFQYNRFNRLVGSLGRRGAPKELIDQVRAAGPTAMQDVYNLTKLTPSQWKQYVAAFKAGQNAVKAATMAQLNGQIGMYKQHGIKVAQAIVSGITSQDQKVSAAIDNMLRKAIGLKPTASYKPTAHKGNIAGNTTIHVHGSPGDYHKTTAAIRHSLFRTRIHTGGF